MESVIKLNREAGKGESVKLELYPESLDEVPEELLNFVKSIQLDFRNRRLTGMPSYTWRLELVTNLTLEYNWIDTFPESILNFPNLQELDLRHNRLTTLSENIYRLGNLRVLNVAVNSIESLPNGLCKLESLEILHLGANQLQHLPDDLANLKKLKKLWVNDNYIENLPTQIGELTCLEGLYAHSNRLSSLPEDIRLLENLIVLSLHKNKLEWLPKGICNLKKLEVLTAQGNCLQTLPTNFGLLVSLKKLKLEENPLKQPPQEVCKRGIRAIDDYQAELVRGEQAEHCQIKLVLVGKTYAGKTTLKSALIQGGALPADQCDPVRTPCVEVTPWSIGTTEFNVYDFGGDDMYHLIHQFFLSRKALHLLVVNMKEYTKEKYEELVGYWIRVLSTKAPGAPFQLVGTHADEVASAKDVGQKCQDITRRVQATIRAQISAIEDSIRQVEKELAMQMQDTSERVSGETSAESTTEQDIAALEEYRAHLQGAMEGMQNTEAAQYAWGIRAVSSTQGWGIEELRDELISHSRDESIFPSARHVLPYSWSVIGKQLDTWSKDPTMDTCISLQQVQEIAHQHNISDDNVTMALQYYHDVGKVLFYQKDSPLGHHVFHNLPKLIDLFKEVFRRNVEDILILEDPNIRQAYPPDLLGRIKDQLTVCGVLPVSILHTILEPKIPDKARRELAISLLQMFGICYKMQKGSESFDLDCDYLRFPWYLNASPPQDLQQYSTIKVGQHTEDEIEVRCEFRGFCPAGLYERFSVAINPHMPGRRDWKDGILAIGYPTGRLEVLITRETNQQEASTVISIVCQMHNLQALRKAWDTVLPLVTELKRLLREWPALVYSLETVCPHCSKNGIHPPTRFSGRYLDTVCNIEDEVPCTAGGVKQYVQKALVCPPEQPLELSNTGFDEELRQLVREIREWEPLARALGLTPATIQEIRENHRDRYSEQKHAMFVHWKEQTGDRAYVSSK
ncbi:hypothetical protein Bbelb_196270 [Branchiostoma belcheri]|nr:hypothetical protein Bbelb_196270 [Branchiostoma belcheri]